ncbi:MAG: hypothetical protein K6F58_05640 [Bacteroidales bacterium]|nr:hypothetical protein [Bacteroidales bacterium]
MEIKRYEYLLKEARPVSRAEYQKALGLEERTAQRHLKTFVEKGIAKQAGSGRGTTYEAEE